MKKTILISMIVFVSAACTPQQIATFERLSGTTLPSDLKDAALQAPDEPFSTPWGTINTDGSVTQSAAPKWSRCPQFYDEALAAGWPKAQWNRIDYIMYRESRCDPSQYNGKGRDNSYGLMQLNMKALKSWVGPLVDWDFTKLYDPYTNLAVAKELYRKAIKMWGCGWRPWAFRC